MQQVTGQKKLFSSMIRPPSTDWSLPPRPLVVNTSLPAGSIVRHVLGSSILRGQRGLDFISSMALEIAKTAKVGDDISYYFE